VSTLILGGGGFIGVNLLTQLSEARPREKIVIYDRNLNSPFFSGDFFRVKNRHIELIKANINDVTQIDYAIRHFRPKKIFHLAANSDIRRSSLDAEIDLEDTFLTTSSILQAIPNSLRPIFVFASSSAVYGEAAEKFKESSIKKPISYYGITKLASEKLLADGFARQKISKLRILRFPNVVGRYMTHGVLFDFLHQIESGATKLSVLGDGNQNKPFMSAATLIKAILPLSDLPNDMLTVNISAKDSISIKEVAALCVEITGQHIPIEFGDSDRGWKTDVPRYSLDTSILERVLPDFSPEASKIAVRDSIEQFWTDLRKGSND
jgi:UDP-glucose 4-epimerase